MVVLLGLDVGTTRIKAALTDSCGTVIDIESCPADVQIPFEGASEMNMRELWEKLCSLTLQLRERNPLIWKEIAGTGISAQGDGMWAIDRHGEPVGNAILWNDTRTRTLDNFDDQALDRFLIGNSSTALFSGAYPLILKWMKLNQPDRYKKISTVLRCKDWLNYRLTGNILSDFSDFSTCGINIFDHSFVDGLFDYLDIREAGEMMPELSAPVDVIGSVNTAAAAECGIPVGTPVVAGAIDVVATAVGTGLSAAGESCVILGTTLCSEALINSAEVDVSDRRGSSLCSIYPDKYLRVMASLSGCSAIDWARDLLAPDLSYQEIEKELEQIPAGSNGILYHPYISGERAPFRDPFACAGFYGLTRTHGRFDMLRAAFEGMVLSIMDCHRVLPEHDGSVFLSGGGASNNLSCQMIADALGKKVIRPRVKELGIAGITEIIRTGLNIESSDTDGTEGTDVFMPDPDKYIKYQSLYKTFKDLQEGMTGFWKQRGESQF